MGYDFSGKRILVADNDESIVTMLEAALREKGAEVISVMDGSEVMDTFRDEHGKFDMLILDVKMPGMGGVDIALNIRSIDAIPGTTDVPVIVIAAHEKYFNVVRAEIAGVCELLHKPIEEERLYDAVAKYIR
ncbi:MAG: response regulator [Lachnospiraceae bacterium]|nr:response regulator [Lachnospiraceae bacterium]